MESRENGHDYASWDGRLETYFANVSILNYAIEVHTVELYRILHKEYKKGTTYAQEKVQETSHIWSIKCGGTMFMNFATLLTLIG